MGAVVVAIVSAFALAGHSRSEGRSRFEVTAPDRVAITIQLLTLDLPELCEVDLSLSDDERRRHEERRFEACVEQGLPRWLRLRTDDGACTVTALGTRRGEGLDVFIDGVASCPPLAGSTLTIDWGLFAGQRLDHVSTATVVVVPGVEERSLLSRRQNRIRVKIPRPIPKVAVAAGVVAAVAAAAGVAWWRRRRSQERSGPRGLEDGPDGA